MTDDFDDIEWDRQLSAVRNRMPVPRYRAAGQVVELRTHRPIVMIDDAAEDSTSAADRMRRTYTARPYKGRQKPTLQIASAASDSREGVAGDDDPAVGRGWWRPSKRAQERSHAITVAMLIVTCSLGAVMVAAAAAWVWKLVH